MFRDLSIRHKLTILLISIVGFVLVAASAAIAFSDVRAMRQQMADQYSTLAKLVAAYSAPALSIADVDPSSAKEVISDLQVEQTIVFAALYNVQGKEIAIYQTPQIIDNPTPPQTPSLVFTGGFLDVVDEVRMSDGKIVGRIYLRATTTELNAHVRRTVVITAVVFFVALGVALLLSYVLQRVISAPILELARLTTRVSTEQDYSLRAEKRANDELGILSDGFNAMLSKIREKESALARTNLELESSVKTMRSTLDQLQDREARLEQTNTELDKAIQAVRNAVLQLSSMSEELIATTAQQTGAAQQQAAAVSQTVATVNEVAETSVHASEMAGSVGDAAKRAFEAGSAGRQAVTDSIEAMGKVSEYVDVIGANTLVLAERAQAIGEIIESVKDIADQTNLLALNAAIEASRAGEYGRGFAVVASDVKQLAEQSKRSAQQISLILSEIRQATNTTVLSTEQGSTAGNQATQIVARAGETIESLANAIDEASQAASRIVVTARQQAQGMEQVSEAMKHIDTTARQNSVAARQVEQTARNLTDLSCRLARLISEHETMGTRRGMKGTEQNPQLSP
jgi:methyl-accepting chemotaxis protein